MQALSSLPGPEKYYSQRCATLRNQRGSTVTSCSRDFIESSVVGGILGNPSAAIGVPIVTSLTRRLGNNLPSTHLQGKSHTLSCV